MIPILKREASWMAVEKPVGLATQAPAQFESLESSLRDQLGDEVQYLAMPHRLDVPVSGVVLAALTKKAARLLSEQFRARKVTKTYQAIVQGDASNVDTLWEDWIVKVPDQARVQRASESAPGAQLGETKVASVNFDAQAGVTHLTLQPITGRMHQLRVGAAWRGFPIVGDSIYGDGGESPISLRAVAIEFHDPANGKRVRIEANDLPEFRGPRFRCP